MKSTRALQRSLGALERTGSSQSSQRLSWQSTQTLQRCRTSSEPLASKRPCKAIETSRKPFSTSQCLHKKGAKAAREEKREVKQAAGAEAAGTTDPYDFADLEAHIAPALERLKSELSKLRGGGRFNPEVVENLRVQPEKGSNQSVRLSDLAQVVPKGRQVQIIVGEKDHVKPISSAIQSSSLSLTPQPDPSGHNPLLLVLNIPPPTAESRKAAVLEAAKAGDSAASTVRDGRAKQQKKLRALELAKSARPDDLKKAKAMMEKVVDNAHREVKKIVDEKTKVLEQG